MCICVSWRFLIDHLLLLLLFHFFHFCLLLLYFFAYLCVCACAFVVCIWHMHTTYVFAFYMCLSVLAHIYVTVSMCRLVDKFKTQFSPSTMGPGNETHLDSYAQHFYLLSKPPPPSPGSFVFIIFSLTVFCNITNKELLFIIYNFFFFKIN